MKVSVLMPAYNAEKYISFSIESLLNQSLKNFELLIIDDCSNDNTYSLICKYTQIDKRIKVFRNHSNMGIGFCRNFLMNKAIGEYFAFLDSDDIALSNRLLLQAQFLDVNPDIFGVGGARNIIDTNGVFLRKLSINLIDRLSSSIFYKIHFCNCFCNSTMMFRSTSERFKADFSPAEDYEFWSRMCLINNYKIINLKETIVNYRIHDNNTSNKNQIRQLNLNEQIVRRNFSLIKSDYHIDLLSIHHHLNPLFQPQKKLIYYLKNTFLVYFLFSKVNKPNMRFNKIALLLFIYWDFSVRFRIYTKKILKNLFKL